METSEQPSYMHNTQDPVTMSNLQLSHVVITEETNHLLFPNAAESFGFWDTQNVKEYDVLKRSVSDKIVKCLCDLPDTPSLDADLVRLKNERKQLDDQLELQADNKCDQLKRVKVQEEQLEQELLAKQVDAKDQIKKIEELYALIEESAIRILKQRKEVQQLQHEVEGQKVSAEQFKNMKFLLIDLVNEDQFYKRQMQDILERGYNQQVRLSRAKKQLMDKVEKFNSHAQNIGLDSDICSASEKDNMELVLPLPPQSSDLKACSHSLAKLAKLLVQRRGQNDQRRRKLEQSMLSSLF